MNVELYTIENIAGSTHHISDQHRCLAALAYAKNRGVPKEAALAIILTKRSNWLNWLTVVQRQWQCNTRNHNKARFHDSIELREKYVRC